MRMRFDYARRYTCDSQHGACQVEGKEWGDQAAPPNKSRLHLVLEKIDMKSQNTIRSRCVVPQPRDGCVAVVAERGGEKKLPGTGLVVSL